MAATASPAPRQARRRPTTAGPTRLAAPSVQPLITLAAVSSSGVRTMAGKQGGLGRPGDGQTERGERSQKEDHYGRCGQADGDGHRRHRRHLQGVADPQDRAGGWRSARAPRRVRTDDTGNQLHQHHHHAGGGTAVAVGEDQQGDPDTELRRPEQRVGESDPAQNGIRNAERNTAATAWTRGTIATRVVRSPPARAAVVIGWTPGRMHP